MRRRGIAFLLALWCPMGAVGCSGDSVDSGDPATATTAAPTDADTSTSTPTPVVGEASFAEGPCPEAAAVEPPATVRCGTLTVPERHDRPGGPQVRLPVATVSVSDAPAPDPVLYIDGGPGGDGVGFAADAAEAPLAADRDVVMVGQRGTPLADPTFDCPEVEAAAIDAFDEALDDSSAAASSEALQACFSRVSARTPDFETYDTSTAADDLEAARIALGYEQWNLYGVSYGTRLALEVMRRHPTGVRSVVLDSTYPPDVDAYATLVPGAQRSFSEVIEACAADPACAAFAPDMSDRFDALYERLEREPVDSQGADPETGETVTVRWDGTRLAMGLFSSLYSADLIPILPSLLVSLEGGDFTLATAYYLDYSARSMESVAEGLYLAVECRERAPFTDREEIARVEAAAPRWLVEAVNAETDLDSCDIWRTPAASASTGEPVESDLPSLVLAGRFDPITPPAWGEHAAETLSLSTYVEVPDGSHGVSLGACGGEITASFFAAPHDEPDTTCLASAEVAWSIP